MVSSRVIRSGACRGGGEGPRRKRGEEEDGMRTVYSSTISRDHGAEVGWLP